MQIAESGAQKTPNYPPLETVKNDRNICRVRSLKVRVGVIATCILLEEPYASDYLVIFTVPRRLLKATTPTGSPRR